MAHVDAGKTSLTERLLYAAGVIDVVGSVDDGSTQTDSLALERQRGITIKTAVATFAIDELRVNLIDTPGHPDFIAEVERALGVLDGAVLVISAVEGVQAQTRVLMRTLQRLCIPTLIFVNKLDRAGALYEGVLRQIAQKLTSRIVPMGEAADLGTAAAAFKPIVQDDVLLDVLTEHDDDLLQRYVDGAPLALHDVLAQQTRRALVHPVYFGSAITGAGTDALTDGIRDLLPRARSTGGPLDGTVFKVERGPAGEKIAMYGSSTVRRPFATASGTATATARSRPCRRTATATRATASAPGRSANSGACPTSGSATRSPTPTTRQQPDTSRRGSPHRPWRPWSRRAARPTRATCASRSPSSPSRTR
ncbi:GTP-binding protein [Kribbella jejuensis]|uniref:GTP-binding protein n=1 Tax=Kribbella jejuensis TaxID=236068 RepID=UPI001EE229D8|nr:GTP-binding protein [Kribbella jejuensis]